MALETNSPTIRSKIAPWRTAGAIFLCIAIAAFYGLIAHGDIPMRRMPPELAGLFFVVLTVCTVFLIFKFSKLDFTKPSMTVGEDGIEYQPLSKLIPWPAVEKIDSVVTFRTEMLHVIVKKDTDSVLLAELKRWNHGFMPRTVIISPDGFEGFSPAEVKVIVYGYFQRHSAGGINAATSRSEDR